MYKMIWLDVHANMNLFSEWSIMENDMGDGLQKAGHYMDG